MRAARATASWKPGIDIVRFGWFTTKSGRRQRYGCKVCGGTLSTNTGTTYAGLHCGLDVVATLRVEGLSISAAVRVERRLRIGATARLQDVLVESEDSERLNTSFVERLNLTIRQGSAYLLRQDGLARTATAYRIENVSVKEPMAVQRMYRGNSTVGVDGHI